MATESEWIDSTEILCGSDEPAMLVRPCVDCGLITGRFCDGPRLSPTGRYIDCFAADRCPTERWAQGQRTPLCSRCDWAHGLPLLPVYRLVYASRFRWPNHPRWGRPPAHAVLRIHPGRLSPAWVRLGLSCGPAGLASCTQHVMPRRVGGISTVVFDCYIHITFLI